MMTANEARKKSQEAQQQASEGRKLHILQECEGAVNVSVSLGRTEADVLVGREEIAELITVVKAKYAAEPFNYAIVPATKHGHTFIHLSWSDQ